MAVQAQTGRGPPATEPLLEREAELAAIGDLLEAARRGFGGLGHWRIVDAFPTTVTGKVQKFRLREYAIEQLGRRRDAR